MLKEFKKSRILQGSDVEFLLPLTISSFLKNGELNEKSK
jgi:hypothetical protein